MNCVYEITTPANTPITSAVETVLNVPVGIVTKVEVQFPPGPAGLLHCCIYRSNNQIWPYNPDADYRGENQVISIPANYEITQPPLYFLAYTWNLDDTYEHLVMIRFDVEAPISEELLTWAYLEATG